MMCGVSDSDVEGVYVACESESDMERASVIHVEGV